MSKPPTKSQKPLSTAVSLDGLSPDQAFSIGATIGELLDQGMPTDRARDTTVALAEFVRRGIAAQKAVDEILADQGSCSRCECDV